MALVLGIESSCDETAVALVDSQRRIVAQCIASQDAEHAPFGGVVPEIAARAHAERLAPEFFLQFPDDRTAFVCNKRMVCSVTILDHPNRVI